MKVACQRTYATLCIYSESEANLAAVLMALIGLEATRIAENTKPLIPRLRPPRYGWFHSSQSKLQSLDFEDHVRWLLALIGKPEVLGELRRRGCEFKIMCFWESEGMGGGPVIDHELATELSKFGIGLEFDVYLGGCDRQSQ